VSRVRLPREITAASAARKFGVAKKTVLRWIAAGLLPGRRATPEPNSPFLIPANAKPKKRAKRK